MTRLLTAAVLAATMTFLLGWAFGVRLVRDAEPRYVEPEDGWPARDPYPDGLIR